MRDQASNLDFRSVIDPAVLAADNTPAAIDLRGGDSATIVLTVGVGGITFTDTNKVEFKLTHSDDNATYTAVEQNHVNNATVTTGGVVKSLVTAQPAATVSKIGYVGGKRYLKLLADFSGTHGTGTPIAALLVRGRLTATPAA